MKAIKNSKRTVKKRIYKELKRLFPEMHFYVRKPTGFIYPSILPFKFHVDGQWTVWIGKKNWPKSRCEREGHVFHAWDEPDMIEALKKEQERILNYEYKV